MFITNLGTASLNRSMSRLWLSLSASIRYFFNDRLPFQFGFTNNRSEIFELTCWLKTRSSSNSRLDVPLRRAWEKQLLNYLRGTEVEVGLLLNFGPSAQFRRLVFDNERKKIRENLRESAEEKLADTSTKEEI